MLNTEQDPVLERVNQRRTFSPGRVVGANKSSSSFMIPSSLSTSSSSLSTSPLGLLWGPHRDSPTGKRFSGGEQDEEANFYAGEAGSTNFNGFAGRYASGGNLNNLFATKFYSGAYPSPTDDGAPDMDALGSNLDLDLSHLDLGTVSFFFFFFDKFSSPLTPSSSI